MIFMPWFFCCPKTPKFDLNDSLLSQQQHKTLQFQEQIQKDHNQETEISKAIKNGSNIKEDCSIQQLNQPEAPISQTISFKKVQEQNIISQKNKFIKSNYRTKIAQIKHNKTLTENSKGHSDRKYSVNDIDDESNKNLIQLGKSHNKSDCRQQECHLSFYSIQEKNQPQISALLEGHQKLKYIYTKNSMYLQIKCKKRSNLKEPLQYILQKNHNKLIAIIGLTKSINEKIDTLRKTNELIWAINYHNQCSGLYEMSIDSNKLKCLNMKRMERILISFEHFSNFKDCQSFMKQIMKFLSQKERKKLIFLFPYTISMESVCKIIYQVYKEEFSKFDIQKYLGEYNFDLQYFETTNLGRGVVVRLSSLEPYQKNLYYDCIKCSLSILGKCFNHERYYKILKQFYQLIKKRPATDLILLKQMFRQNCREYKQKIREIRNFEAFDVLIKDYENYRLEDNKDILIITQNQKQKIIQHFQRLQKKQPETPNNQEWDDDLQESDIKLARQSSVRYMYSPQSRLDFIANTQIMDDSLFSENQIQRQLGLGNDDTDEDFQYSSGQGEKILEQLAVQGSNIPKFSVTNTRKRSWDL